MTIFKFIKQNILRVIQLVTKLNLNIEEVFSANLEIYFFKKVFREKNKIFPFYPYELLGSYQFIEAAKLDDYESVRLYI